MSRLGSESPIQPRILDSMLIILLLRDGQRRMLTDGNEPENDQALAIRGRSRSRSPSPSKKEEEDEELEEKDDLAIGPAPMIPPGGYSNTRDAEEAFIWLLKKTKVDESWSWEKVMGTIITEPLYKALNTSAEKKNAYQKVCSYDQSRRVRDIGLMELILQYVNNLIANREQIRKDRLDRFRPYIHRLMARNTKHIKSWTSFRTADERFQGERYWKDIDAEDERRQLFDEFVHDMRKKEQVSRDFYYALLASCADKCPTR